MVTSTVWSMMSALGVEVEVEVGVGEAAVEAAAAGVVS